MQQSVEKIHRDFKTAVVEYDDVLFTHLRNIEEEMNKVGFNATSEAYSSTVRQLFSGSKSVQVLESVKQKFMNLTNNKRQVKEVIDELTSIHLAYPHKLIHYGQMIHLLEKYNLFVAPSEFYKEHLPPANALEVENFVNGPNVKAHWGGTLKHVPLCAQIFGERSRHEDFAHQLFTCAPISYFNRKGLNKLGRELYQEQNPKFALSKTPNKPTPPDPIVLAPIAMKSELGKRLRPFFVVTAFGPEAKDPEVVNEKMN